MATKKKVSQENEERIRHLRTELSGIDSSLKNLERELINVKSRQKEKQDELSKLLK